MRSESVWCILLQTLGYSTCSCLWDRHGVRFIIIRVQRLGLTPRFLGRIDWERPPPPDSHSFFLTNETRRAVLDIINGVWEKGIERCIRPLMNRLTVCLPDAKKHFLCSSEWYLNFSQILWHIVWMLGWSSSRISKLKHGSTSHGLKHQNAWPNQSGKCLEWNLVSYSTSAAMRLFTQYVWLICC